MKNQRHKTNRQKGSKFLQNNRRIGKRQALEKLAKAEKRRQDQLKLPTIIAALEEGDDELLDPL